ncbi:hypothetical protein SASPL_101887 [Salvia splendens]|uniref:Retrotransposon gag domain-containing protein n=1 Tax=Salvia splendens TaxID=180675 RepID=A0A8X8YQ70_SALSN|nr:hypothetical protein SASPL_101887 [Salvia splendens]
MAPLPGKHGVTLLESPGSRRCHHSSQSRIRSSSSHRAENTTTTTRTNGSRDGCVIDDSGISSLHAHDEREPTHAITTTPGMQTIAIKSGVLTVLSHFYGLSKECPFAFLDEFCRYCDIQPVPAGSTSEDYRLKPIPFVLKGDASVWLSRLPEGSIRTWAEQEYDEPLVQYWDRFQGLLQAFPNHKLGEKEIYSIFYGGLTVDSKNDLNLAAQGDFSKTLFSQAKNILVRLIEAKR